MSEASTTPPAETRTRTTRDKVGRAVGLSFTVAIFCNLLAAFGVDGTLFFVVRSVAAAVFTVAAVAWIVLWLLGRRAH